MVKDIHFYKFVVNNQVFYKSQHTYALVNIKPIVPGHVLVVPLRSNIIRFGDLTSEESQDYMLTLQLIHKFIIYTFKADSLNLAIQDGPEAGQSIPHLHTHIIPRYKTDGFGDTIYAKLRSVDLESDFADFFKRKDIRRADMDSDVSFDPLRRKVFSDEELAQEATWLKNEIQAFLQK